MKKLKVTTTASAIVTLDGQDMSNVYSTCTIDSCEYVVVSGVTAPTHKGNCKYCAQRDSIKWEKRKAEIVELLKRESID